MSWSSRVTVPARLGSAQLSLVQIGHESLDSMAVPQVLDHDSALAKCGSGLFQRQLLILVSYCAGASWSTGCFENQKRSQCTLLW